MLDCLLDVPQSLGGVFYFIQDGAVGTKNLSSKLLDKLLIRKLTQRLSCRVGWWKIPSSGILSANPLLLGNYLGSPALLLCRVRAPNLPVEQHQLRLSTARTLRCGCVLSARAGSHHNPQLLKIGHSPPNPLQGISINFCSCWHQQLSALQSGSDRSKARLSVSSSQPLWAMTPSTVRPTYQWSDLIL